MAKFRSWLEYADVAIGLLLTMASSVLGLIGVIPEQVVSTTVLMALGLTLIAMLRIRAQVSEISDVRNQYVSVLESLRRTLDAETTFGEVIRYEYPDLNQLLRDAVRIDVAAGLSLKSSVGQYYSAFQSAL